MTRSTPRARRVARERGVDLRTLAIPGRPIRVADVLAAVPANPRSNAPLVARSTGSTAVIDAGPLQAWSMVEVDYSNVERSLRAVGPAWRSRLGFPLTHLPYVLRAVALGLASFPRLNGEGTYAGRSGAARIDLAVQSSQVGRGPVLRDVRERGVAEIAVEVQRLQGAALSGSLGEEGFAQATFEVVDHVGHGAVIGTPRVGGSMIAALAVHQVAPQASVVAIDQHSHALGIRPKGALVLTWGSTSVDAGAAAGFLSRVKELLEQTQWEIAAPG